MMKFPLAGEPFAPLALTTRDADDFDTLTQSLLNETLLEFDEFVSEHKRVPPSSQWKSIKTRENLTVYRSTDRDDAMARSHSQALLSSSSARMSARMSQSSGSDTGHAMPSSLWTVPRTMLTGSVVGTLEDVLFGYIAPDTHSMQIKASYLMSPHVDARMLAELRGVTRSRPFDHLSLKWCAIGTGTTLKRHRDFVYVDRCGVHVLPSGERIAYMLVSSVELPQCPELKSHSVVRGKLSVCSLWREQPGKRGSLEVYSTAFHELKGSAADRVSLAGATNLLLSAWKLAWCGQNKRLSWMMKESAASRTRHHSQSQEHGVGNALGQSSTCSICTRNVSLFRTLTTCELCLDHVCSRCFTTRKLSYVHHTGELVKVPTGFCKNCTSRAAAVSAAGIMIREFTNDADASKESLSSSFRSTNDTSSQHSMRVATAQTKRPTRTVSCASSSTQSRMSCNSPPPTVVRNHYEDETEFPVESCEEWEENGPIAVMPLANLGSPVHATSLGSPRDPMDYQKQLWMRMNQLRVAAEETYQLTKQNEDAMRWTTLSS